MNLGNVGQINNMYIGLNGCSYFIWRNTVLEGSLHVRR